MYPLFCQALLMLFVFIHKISNAASDYSTGSSREQQQQEIFKLLRDGDERIKLDDNYRDVVLLIGNAGAGKSTTALILATDCTDLEVYSARRGFSKLIKDVNSTKIGSSIVSKTIFPDLIINPENDVAFYDCPGFRDTRRNTSIDLVNTLFLQRITRHAKSVKILMVVHYNAVMSGGNRGEFLNLLESTLNLVKTVERFKDSIGMVATKVYSDLADEQIVEGIQNFLTYEVKDELDSVIESSEDVSRAEILLDSLVADGKNDKPKIHFTPVPKDSGRLSDMPEMMESREKLGEIVYNGLEYVTVTPADFGLPFSVEARELVDWILGEIDNFTELQVQQVVNQFWGSLVEKMAQVEDLSKFLSELNMLKNVLQPLVADRNDTSLPLTSTLALGIIENFNIIGVNLSQAVELDKLEDQDRFLILLHNVTDQVPAVEVNKWVRPVQDLLTTKFQNTIDWFQSLVDLERRFCSHIVGSSGGFCEDRFLTLNTTYVTSQNYQKFVAKFVEMAENSTAVIPTTPEPEYEQLTYKFLNGMIERGKQEREQRTARWVQEVAESIMQYFLNSNRTDSIDSLLQQLSEAKVILGNISTSNNQGFVRPEDLLRSIRQSFSTGQGFNVDTGELDHIIHEAAVSDLLTEIATDTAEINASVALRPLEDVGKILSESVTWCKFLKEIKDKLSEVEDPSGPVSEENENSTAAPPTFIVRANISTTLELLSAHLGIQPPVNLTLDPSETPMFVKNLNDILYFTWQRSSRAISVALNDLSQNLIAHLHSQTHCSPDALTFSGRVATIREALDEKLQENPHASKDSPILALYLGDMLHTVFGPSVYNITKQQLEHIDRQRPIFLILEYAMPGLAKMDLSEALFKLKPVSGYLRRLSNWYGLLRELQEKLVGLAINLNSFYTELPDSLNSSNASWYNFVNESVSFFSLESSVSLDSIRKDVDQHGAHCHVQAVAKAAYEVRTNNTNEIIALAGNKLLQKLSLQAQVPTVSVSKFNDQLQGMNETFTQLAHLTVVMKTLDLPKFLTFLNVSLTRCGTYGEESMEILTLASPPANLLTLISTAFPENFNFNLSDGLKNLDGPREFIEDSIKWYNFLYTIDQNLSKWGFQFTASNTSSMGIAPARMLISSEENSLKILGPLSQLFSIDLPSVHGNVSDHQIFLHYLERLVYNDWQRRKEEVAQISKTLSNLLTESYFNMTKTYRIQELRNLTAKGFHAFTELQKSKNDSFLLTATGLASRLQDTLKAIEMEPQTEISYLLTRISVQHDVLVVYGNVLPSFSHIDLQRSLLMFSPLTYRLKWQSDWFKLLSDLHYELSNKDLMHRSYLTVKPSVSWQIQTWDSASRLVVELANIMKIKHAVDFEKVPQIVDSDTALAYLSRLTDWVYDARVRDVQNRIQWVALQVTSHLDKAYNVSGGKLREEMASAVSVLQLLNSTAESPAVVTAIKRKVEDVIETSNLFPNTASFQPSLNAIGNHAAIFNVLFNISPQFGKLTLTGVLNQQLFTNTAEVGGYWMKWYEFLATARAKAFGNNTVQQLPPKMYLSQEKWHTVLARIAQYHSLSYPSNITIRTTLPIDFLDEANTFIYNAWLVRMESISSTMEELAEDIEKAFESHAMKFTKVEDLLNDIGNVSAVFSNTDQFRRCTSCKITPATLPIILRRAIESTKLTVPTSEEHFSVIKQHGDFLRILATASEELGGIHPNQSFEALGKIVAYLRRKNQWYNYMAELDNKLSAFQIQRDRDTVQSFLGRGTSQLTPEKTIDYVRSVSRTLSLSPPSDYAQNFKYPLRINSALHHLMNLLERALFSSVTCDTSDGVLTINGVYVILSQAFSTCSWRSVNRVVITAYHTFFVDTDLSSKRVTGGKTLDLIIIARNIYNVASHSIELLGDDAVQPSSSGRRDGSPGLPGAESGAFVLITDNIQGQRITVSLKGGRGSDGLEGSSGTLGSNGISPSESNWGNYTNPPCDPTIEFSVSINSSFKASQLKQLCPYDICNGVVYRVIGKDGHTGGQGGDGGKGGAGGIPSYHTIKILGGNSNGMNLVNLISSSGQGGEDGGGGAGGRGGFAGDIMHITFRRQISVDENSFLSSDDSISWNCETAVQYSPGGSSSQRASDGERGRAGGNSQGQHTAVGSRFAPADARKYVNDYARESNGNFTWDIFGKSAHDVFIQRLSGTSFMSS